MKSCCKERPRLILINLKHFEDVEMIHRCNGSHTFQAYEDKSRNEKDGFHLKFTCKKSLYVSNYQFSRLGWSWSLPFHIYVFSSGDKVLDQTFKWYQNDLLNSAFKMATIENNSWIQAIYLMLSNNGYRESWLAPSGVDSNVHLAFRQRLWDQCIQHWKAIIHASHRLDF